MGLADSVAKGLNGQAHHDEDRTTRLPAPEIYNHCADPKCHDNKCKSEHLDVHGRFFCCVRQRFSRWLFRFPGHRDIDVEDGVGSCIVHHGLL